MRYLTAEEVLRFSEIEAGPNLLGDFGLLESAILRPQTTIGGQDAYPDIHSKAAALFHSLVLNHPFVDGNKRTAVLALIVFYGINGWDFIAEQGAVVDLALDVAEHRLDVGTLAGVLKQLARSQQPS